MEECYVLAWKKLLNEFSDKAKEQNLESGDYVGTDGLVYCGKCHTAKQARVSLFGVDTVMWGDCSCKTEQYLKERKLIKDLENKRITLKNKDSAFNNKKPQDWKFENDNGEHKKIIDIAHKFVENFENPKITGLLFYGETGTGKSFASGCILNALLDKGYSCYMTSFPTEINILSGMFEGKQEHINKLADYDLLVIDDFGAERKTEYSEEIVYNIINARNASAKPTIITTNYTTSRFNNPQSEQEKRIFSRIYEMCVFVKAEGEDSRKIKMKENIAHMRDIISN